MAIKSEALIVDDAAHEKRIVRLEERKTPELVIAFVGPIASGVTKSSEIFSDILVRDYDYQSFIYKVSDIIKDSVSFVGEEDLNDLAPAQRIERLQKIGNKLRERFGDNYLAKKCIDQIANNRLEHDGYRKDNGKLIPNPRIFVHVIDSLKHPS